MARNAIVISGEAIEATIDLDSSRLSSLKSRGLKRGGDDIEVMYQGGAPDGAGPRYNYLMFPIIGKTKDDRVRLNGDDIAIAQHGIARDLPWEVLHRDPSSVAMRQTYEARTKVLRREKGIESSWPFDYAITNAYRIGIDDSLVLNVVIENRSEASMPYTLGWHFTVAAPSGTAITIMNCNEPRVRDMPLESVTSAKGNVIVFDEAFAINCRTVEYEIGVEHNFGSMQVWAPAPEADGVQFAGIEPITARPLSRVDDYDPQRELRLQPGYAELGPGQAKTFTAAVRIIEHRD